MVQNAPINKIDPWGLADNSKDECCDDNKALKDNLKTFLKKLLKKIESGEKKIGDKDRAKVLDKLNKAIFAIDAAKRICKAKDPGGCNDFLAEPNYIDCTLCCNSIHSLMGKEVGGVGFSITCKLACKDFD